jgi:DNA (cytosine-5)-methyltransferase 1
MTTASIARPKGASRPHARTAKCPPCDDDARFLRRARPAYETGGPTLRLMDLFCGCGGLSLGIAEATRRLGAAVQVALAVDLDPDATAVYRDNFPGADVRERPVEEFFDGSLGSTPSRVERAVLAHVGPVDILVAGPPCQGHSNLNNRTRRSDVRNALYARVARAAQIFEPSLVIIENVPMVTRDVENVLDVARHGLAQAGYRVADRVVDLTLLGVPQRRRRHVLVATRPPASAPGPILDSLEPRCPRHRTRSVRWAIRDLVDTRSDGLLDSASVPSKDNVKRMRWLFDHGEYDLPNRLRPPCHRSEHSYVSMYGRLEWDEPAQTVTTGFGSMGQGRYVHPTRQRTLTPHEAARLQMLPDFWDFSAARSRGALARLIGNTVPPPLASAIAERVLPDLLLARSGRDGGQATTRRA